MSNLATHVRVTEDQSLWPTPRSSPLMNQTMTSNLANRNKGNLEEKVAKTLWPTPRTSGGSRPNGKGGKVLDEEVKISMGLRQRGKKLTDQMLPTPKARDWHTPMNEQYVKPNSQGWTVTRKGTGVDYGANLPDVINYQEKMWPTPRASVGMSMGLSENMAKLKHKKYLETEMAYEIHKNNNQIDQPTKQLNSEWVTWLMGYPKDYLNISTENLKTSQELHQEKKTEPKN